MNYELQCGSNGERCIVAVTRCSCQRAEPSNLPKNVNKFQIPVFLVIFFTSTHTQKSLKFINNNKENEEIFSKKFSVSGSFKFYDRT